MLTVMSRNGCDQVNSSAASRMAARVRSDLPILGVGFGAARGLDDDLLISGIASDSIGAVSDGQTVLNRRERCQDNCEARALCFLAQRVSVRDKEV